MRLWHYKLIPFLPNSQLIAQWRELNSIFKKQDKHILINYVYEYPKEELYWYSRLVINELSNCGINIKKTANFYEYFKDLDCNNYYKDSDLFKKHHTMRYLWQCFANLQEKYDRGQKDFSDELYEKLEMFVQEEGIVARYKVGKEFKL